MVLITQIYIAKPLNKLVLQSQDIFASAFFKNLSKKI